MGTFVVSSACASAEAVGGYIHSESINVTSVMTRDYTYRGMFLDVRFSFCCMNLLMIEHENQMSNQTTVFLQQ